MNFPEYDCENEEILELLSHLPITTQEDYPWMQKYIDDLQLHYKKAEYELAVISAHMIYMFIVYCYILKKKEFDINKIKEDFQCDKEHCPKVITDLSPYLYVHKSEKISFKHLKLDKKTNKQHDSIVNIRDNVAHCSGYDINEFDFIKYIQKCIENIISIKNIVWKDFRRSDKFNQTLNNMVEWSDIIGIFLISPVEFEDLFKEKYNDVIKEKLSDISLWRNMLSRVLLQDVEIDELKVDAQDIVISRLDVQDDDVFCFCSANVEFYFKAMKGKKLYKEQVHTLINHPFTFEYLLSTNESFVEITELPFI